MKQKSIDYGIFFLVLSLVVFGMIMISSVSVYPSFKVTSLMVSLGKLDAPSNSFYLLRNISHVTMGLLLFVFVVKTPYAFFERNAKRFFLSSLVLLVAVLVFGVTYNGAKGWITIPFISFSLQPVEFLKPLLIVYLAYFLKHRKSRLSDFREGFLPFVAILGIVAFLLMLQPDFGSILIITPIAVGMFYIAGGNVKHLGATLLACLLFVVSVYGIGHHTNKEDRNSLSYISDRIDNFISDNQTSIQNKTINFQTEQGLIAIGSGGFFGLGFGKSIQKFGYLPEVEGDFIFSVIAEELGFLGVLTLIGCYLFLAYKGYSVAMGVDDPFAKYTAFGITTWILVQAFINIGVNLNIVPLTGVTLPFISYGGSSLIALLAGMGMLLNISRNSEYISVKGRGRFFRKERFA